MSDPKVDPAADELIIEFPDDPQLPKLPAAGDVRASLDDEEPPDLHTIRERWARLAEVGGGG